MKKLFYLLGVCLLLASCSGNRKATIKGTFVGLEGAVVYLERVDVGAKTVLDSAATDEKGEFEFKFRPDKGYPSFYNITYRGQSITLLIAGGERVKVWAMPDILKTYTVEGSVNSGYIKEITRGTMKAIKSFDSLGTVYGRINDGPSAGLLRNQITNDYADIYVKLKQENIRFIASHRSSLASLFALYQRLPNGLQLFGNEKDFIYFKSVADSLAVLYPESPHVQALQKDVLAYATNEDFNTIEEKFAISEVGYPDVALPDMGGNVVKLSSLKDNVVLLSFWSVYNVGDKIRNREMMDLYNLYRDYGFEVYQVSFDESKPDWIEAVRTQNLPWISVNDDTGIDSYYLQVYNITRMPANFLISRQGQIIGRNLYGQELEKKLEELFK